MENRYRRAHLPLLKEDLDPRLHSYQAEFPPPFMERLVDIYGNDLAMRVAEALRPSEEVFFRINPLAGKEWLRTVLAEVEALAGEARVEPFPEIPGAYRVRDCEAGMLSPSSLMEAGKIYLQNPSSMLAAILLDPQPGEVILDLAAAPGGKALHLLAHAGGAIEIDAVEAIGARYYQLLHNVRCQHGEDKIRCYRADGRSFPRKRETPYDRVLIDAPCSSEARFCRGDIASYDHWSVRKIREMVNKQWALLRRAGRLVKPGGSILYCTCSFAPEENEQIVSGFLRRHPGGYVVEDLELPTGVNAVPGLKSFGSMTFLDDMERCRRILPGGGWGGMFYARLRKVR